ncbi:MAG: S-layer homology domain-containing protein [Clostridia bacterium]|nr:S-layer homology domain-containing protein [Clostridia bacterium]
MKKFINTISALLVAMIVTFPAFAAPTFSDVTDNYEWAKPYINSMAEKGLISG